jgi:hypothetical protein
MKIIAILIIAGTMLISSISERISKPISEMEKKVNQFARVKLTVDLSLLTDNQKEMLRLFFEISDCMDEIYWKQAFGNKHELLDTIKDDYVKKFVIINYGPWERLNGNAPFIKSFGEKAKGANFYPIDMKEEEFKSLTDSSKTSLYTLIQRDQKGKLITVPYHIAFKNELEKAADIMRKAATIAEDPGFKKYLELRAEALITDNYQPSDFAWMDMKTNSIDFVVGPIETYEDQLYGYKASFEAYILLKDNNWSERLKKYAQFLPEMQKKLPVDEAYKSESPGSSSDLYAYDILYYAGDCNAGSKTIAINLPNDEEVQLVKGSRRLQLKNAMKAKYDQIMVPIAQELIEDSLQKHISFDAFFNDVMFHEVAHGLGIKNTINGKGTVKDALKNQYGYLEEGKADILGLYLITQLNEMGQLKTNLTDNYVTFLAGLFRSIRFGPSSAHGKANLVRFNYFKEQGAFTRSLNGKYAVNYIEMQKAMNELSNKILIIQGNGDYNAAEKMFEKYGTISKELENDLVRIDKKGIPVDIVFEQGPSVLNFKNK